MLNEVSKNKMLNELAEVTRAMREAAESKQRCADDRRRLEHEEMFKQVIEIWDFVFAGLSETKGDPWS